MIAAPRSVAAALAFVAVVVVWEPQAAAAAEKPPQLPAKSWLLVDAEDDEVLAARSPARRSAIASTTKLMTAYVARRELPLKRKVTAPPYAASTAESLLNLRAGEKIRVRDLLIGLLLASGNDAAVALAEASAGSVDAFVARMNRAAGRLGLEDTSYANPIGLDQPDNYSTAEDLVALALELREDPFFRRVIDLPEARLSSGETPRTVVNRDNLVRTIPWVNGVKTGYTLKAGYVLVGSGTRRGVTLVSAVLGADSEASRDEATLELLRYGFSLYRRERPLARGERLAAAEVRYRDEVLPLVAARELSLQVRQGEEVEIDVVAPEEVEGPVERGEELGRVMVSIGGEEQGSVPLLASRAVPRASLLERFDAGVPGPRLAAWAVAIGGLATAFGAIVAAFQRRRRRPGDSLRREQ